MPAWPFKLTQRSAFHSERAKFVDELFALLSSMPGVESLAPMGDAQSICEAIKTHGHDLTVALPEHLSKELLGAGPLDFFSSCLLEAPELVFRLLNPPPTGGFTSTMDNHMNLIDTFRTDADDLGLSAMAVRLHFEKGVDRYPYLIALMQFIHTDLHDVPIGRAPFVFEYFPVRRASAKEINWRLLLDQNEKDVGQIPNLFGSGESFERSEEWKSTYLSALDVLQPHLNEGTRPAMMVDKMLRRLVYDQMLPWVYQGVDAESLWRKYHPIIGAILEHQGYDPALTPVYARHIWATGLTVSPSALENAGCTLDDLLPAVDIEHGSFVDKEVPLFLQGPLGVYWSYESSYVLDQIKSLESVVGPIPIERMLCSHFVSGEAITLPLNCVDVAEDLGTPGGCSMQKVLLSSLMSDIVNNPLQSPAGLNRVFQYAPILSAGYDEAAIQKLFINRISTVVSNGRHHSRSKYLDLSLFLSRFGRSDALMIVALKTKELDGPSKDAVADMLVELFRIDGSVARRLGKSLPLAVRDKAFSADLGV